MTALIAASSLRTCFGDGARTFAALLDGRSGVGGLRHPLTAQLNVTAGYQIDEPAPGVALRAGTWLRECVDEVLTRAAVDPRRHRVVALVGTGLRELAAVEEMARTGAATTPSRLHFGPAVRDAAPDLAEVVTLANACSAGGHALALAQDLIETGEADAVVVGAADTTTTSMLAMIGKVTPSPTTQVRPFDRDRTGVLLGEGAAALVVVGETWAGPAVGRLLATGLSCDAVHETAPDVDGICRAVRDAWTRAGRGPHEADLVVAHGTGTALNDPTECAALLRCLPRPEAPLVTGIKGAVGHLSGAAALANVDVALRCLASGTVPPVVGLTNPLPEGDGLSFVREVHARRDVTLAQVNAFGFGGVNAVTLVEAR
ncbi:beta-ketoacyl synthase N-terminal-like domain-containing protein [Micromonospora sp. WMMD714]|uniref:beta-ketoacyl synthase N-terminal-like domain-containing protein n=1 Tax=Micromonospora sp. WMMD714 TaxID=3016097 RepID=UPI00249BB4CC|nr:beta-ketoacyl synthase N-terminal-like domain-containing protein [Micromonospora sp. WMMD714]WFE65113.1 beta-ketoacyl synthase N-terminal-like domain-containing protein [Micromonospora sp. WMMD714]